MSRWSNSILISNDVFPNCVWFMLPFHTCYWYSFLLQVGGALCNPTNDTSDELYINGAIPIRNPYNYALCNVSDSPATCILEFYDCYIVTHTSVHPCMLLLSVMEVDSKLGCITSPIQHRQASGVMQSFSLPHTRFNMVLVLVLHLEWWQWDTHSREWVMRSHDTLSLHWTGLWNRTTVHGWVQRKHQGRFRWQSWLVHVVSKVLFMSGTPATFIVQWLHGWILEGYSRIGTWRVLLILKILQSVSPQSGTILGGTEITIQVQPCYMHVCVS